MKVFDHYAQYYDLLYSVKDYKAEVEYVSGLIQKFLPGARSMLDVGCGTGSHGYLFAERGFHVTGVDRSAEMVAVGMPIRVEGHTDESRVQSSRFRDNWDLSASRAASVASYVQAAHNMDGKLLSAAGYGSTRPISNTGTVAGREANRRVEMLIDFRAPE